MQYWELWYPDAAATGLAFARGQLEPTTVLWVHAAPPTLSVEVRTVADGRRVAHGDRLTRTSSETLPTTRLTIVGDKITRDDRWPAPADLNMPIVLPGGEVGMLHAWWNAADGSEWRWQVEFFNRR